LGMSASLMMWTRVDRIITTTTTHHSSCFML
jgi:hypothetical protein